jgi:hypothetical protein
VGATVVQLGGTDKAPTAPALPTLADALAAPTGMVIRAVIGGP